MSPPRYSVRGASLRDRQIAGSSLEPFATAAVWKHNGEHQGNDLGYGKNAKGLDNPQPSPKGPCGSMDAVQRLDGGRFRFTYDFLSSELKIESGPPEMEP